MNTEPDPNTCNGSELRRALERRILDPSTPAADLVPLTAALQNVSHDEILQAGGVTIVELAVMTTRALRLWAEREQREMDWLDKRREMGMAEHNEFMKFRRAHKKKAAKTKSTARARSTQ